MNPVKDSGAVAPNKACFDAGICDVAVATGIQRTTYYSCEALLKSVGKGW